MKKEPAGFRLLLPFLCALIALVTLLAAPKTASAEAPDEFRALWVYGFGDDFHTPAKVTELIANARAANLNALVVQVRVRGDALYNSNYEPWRVSPYLEPGFDPPADLIAKGHDTSGGKRKIEIHAWMVTYHAWNSANPPPQPDHPYNLHPDWLLKEFDGTVHRTFDPGHPAVQQHIYNVALDIATNYEVDGLNFDYIRYNNPNEGYHDITVARFNELYGRTGIPQPSDPEWKQFRRDQITGLLRKIYLNAIAVRPNVKVSADTITWGNNGVKTIDQWPGSSAYSSVLQDWRGWMEEGILDLNIPMNYYREHNNTSPNHAQAYRDWSTFAKNHKYGRHLAIGPGIYLNTLPNAIAQMRHTRVPTEEGNTAEGVCGYVYHVTNMEGLPFSEFRKALTQPSIYDPINPPMFAEKANIPEMPWKTNPTTGHLMGYVREAGNQQPLDGAMVYLSGPVDRTIQTDPTGFYGFVDLPPGDYSLIANWDGADTPASPVSISIGNVEQLDVDFTMPPPTTGQLEGFVINAANGQPVEGATVHLSAPAAQDAQTNSLGFYKFTNLEPGQYRVSANWEIAPNPTPEIMISITAGVVTGQDLHFAIGESPTETVILDNLDDGVVFTGGDWRTSLSAGYYGSNSMFAHNPGHFEYTGPHTATFTPALPAAGYYQIDTWYVASGNRTPNAPFIVSDGESETAVIVNQQINGSQWFTMVDSIYLDPANDPFVRIENTGDPIVVMADALRWTLLEPAEVHFSITVDTEGQGRVEGIPEGGVAAYGEVLHLEAIGEDGFVFSHWAGKNAWGTENPLSLPVGADLEVRAVFVSPWLDWVADVFDESELQDPDFIAPQGDPFGHGISNLLKFAFGIDLRAPDRTLLPAATADSEGVNLTFRRLQGEHGLDYRVEFSNDFTNWSSDPSRLDETASTPNEDETETVTVRVATNGEGRLFVRLVVTQK